MSEIAKCLNCNAMNDTKLSRCFNCGSMNFLIMPSANSNDIKKANDNFRNDGIDSRD